MKTLIVKLKQEINGENRKEIIDSFEESLAEEITKTTKEKQFFSEGWTLQQSPYDFLYT